MQAERSLEYLLLLWKGILIMRTTFSVIFICYYKFNCRKKGTVFFLQIFFFVVIKLSIYKGVFAWYNLNYTTNWFNNNLILEEMECNVFVSFSSILEKVASFIWIPQCGRILFVSLMRFTMLLLVSRELSRVLGIGSLSSPQLAAKKNSFPILIPRLLAARLFINLD